MQYMRALAPIYSHRVPGFKETQIGFDPIQKRNPNPKRKVKTRLPIDRPVDCAQPKATCFQSVDRAGRPFSATVDRVVDRANLVHVVHAGRPGGRLASSTGRPGGRPEAQSGLLNAPFLAP